MTEQRAEPARPQVPAPAPFQIEHPSQDVSEHWLNALIWGDPGHGKTTLAATADDVEEMRSVLFFDAERGDMVLSDRPWLDVIHSKKYADLARVHEYLRLHCRLRDEFLEGNQESGTKLLNLEQRIKGTSGSEPTLYRTFVVDTLTEVQQNLMYQLLQVNPDTWALDSNISSAEWSEWKQSTDMILMLLRQLRDLPIHVIVTGHSSESEVTKPGIGRMIEKRINLPGKLPGRVPGFWDLFGYLQKVKDSEGKDRYRLWLNDGLNGAWKAKHRFKFVKVDYVDEPTLPKLLSLAQQEWKAADAAKAQGTPNPGVTNARTQPAGPTQSRTATSPAGASARPAPAAAGTRPGRGPVRAAVVRR